MTVAGTPDRSAVITKARELVTFARQHGYRLEELVRIIQDAS
jgi:GntR family transcriptional regulator